MTRISDFVQHQRVIGGVLDSLGSIREIQAQIASGKKSQSYTGIARDTTQLISAEIQLQRVRQYSENNKLAEQRLEVMDQSVGSMFDIASDLKRMLIQASDSSSGQDVPVALQAQNMLEMIAGQLNIKLSGRYLFSGSMTDTAPVNIPVPDPAAIGTPDASYYAGDGVQLAVRADDDVTVTYGVTADRLGFQQIIGALKAAISADVNNQPAQLQTAISMATEALDELSTLRTELGTKMRILSETTSRHEDFAVYAESIVSDFENVDIPLAVTRLAQDQTLLEASFSTLARISELSLAKYLR